MKTNQINYFHISDVHFESLWLKARLTIYEYAEIISKRFTESFDCDCTTVDNPSSSTLKVETSAKISWGEKIFSSKKWIEEATKCGLKASARHSVRIRMKAGAGDFQPRSAQKEKRHHKKNPSALVLAPFWRNFMVLSAILHRRLFRKPRYRKRLSLPTPSHLPSPHLTCSLTKKNCRQTACKLQNAWSALRR